MKLCQIVCVLSLMQNFVPLFASKTEPYWDILEDLPKVISINNILDSVTRQFRQASGYDYSQNSAGINWAENVRYYISSLIEHIPSLQKNVTVNGQSFYHLLKKAIKQGNTSFVNHPYINGGFIDTNFSSPYIFVASDNVSDFFAGFMHEVGHCVDTGFRHLKNTHPCSDESISILFELDAFNILKHFHIKETPILLSLLIGKDFLPTSPETVLQAQKYYNQCHHYTQGFIAAIRALALAQQKFGSNPFDMDQHGKMLDYACNILFQEGHSQDEILKWAHDVPKYLSMVYGSGQSLLSLKDSSETLSEANLKELLQKSGITPVTLSPLSIFFKIVRQAFTFRNLATQTQSFMLTRLGADILFPKNCSQICWPNFITYAESTFVKTYGFFWRSFWNLSFKNFFKALGKDFCLMLFIYGFCNIFLNIKKWGKKFRKSNQHLDQENILDDQNRQEAHLVPRFKNPWFHIWNLACPSILLYYGSKLQLIPEIRKSVLAFMSFSVFAANEFIEMKHFFDFSTIFNTLFAYPRH